MISQERKAKRNAYDRHRRAVLKDTNTSVDVSVKKFHDIHTYICTCCDQLWYKYSVVNACKVRESQVDSAKYLCNKISIDDKEWICRTCNNHLMKNKLPPCAIANGMAFPIKPEFFYLNELECRLLAPRIAFQKLMQAPRGRQLKIHGNIVNVPADVSHTVTMLPRLHSQTATIKVNLKRKLQYKSSALSLNVRPDKVVQAAKWLMSNSTLYKDEKILFNEDWANTYVTEVAQLQNDDNEMEYNDKLSENLNNQSESEDQQTAAGVTDTLFTATDFLEDNEPQNILNVAPAEGNQPPSVFRDKYCEELAYPGIFLGQPRPDTEQRKVKVTYGDM